MTKLQQKNTFVNIQLGISLPNLQTTRLSPLNIDLIIAKEQLSSSLCKNLTQII